MSSSTLHERAFRLARWLEEEQAAGRAQTAPDVAAEALLPEVDLASLLAEMAALRAEVRAETHAARNTREQLEGAVRTLQERDASAASQQAALEAELQRLRAERERAGEAAAQATQSAERAPTRLALDLLERLQPSLDQAQELALPRWRWPGRQAEPGAAALAEALQLTLRRLHDQLDRAGVRRVGAPGDPFDPEVMEAVDVVDEPGVAEGTVVQLVLPGYQDPRGLLRPAQVVVARAGGAALRLGAREPQRGTPAGGMSGRGTGAEQP